MPKYRSTIEFNDHRSMQEVRASIKRGLAGLWDVAPEGMKYLEVLKVTTVRVNSPTRKKEQRDDDQQQS